MNHAERRRLAVPVILTALLASPAAASNLLVNGSFETWSGGLQVGNQPDRIFNNGSLVVPGWNFAIGLSSDLYRDLGASSALSNHYDAAHLDYLAGCGSFSTLHEGISQTFNVAADTWHQVTFKMAPGGLHYSGSWIENASVSSSWLVDVTGAVQAPVSQSFSNNLAHFNASGTTNPLVWTPQSLLFKSNAAGGSVTLQFTAYGDMTHVFVDDVAVVEYPVPFNDECSTASVITGAGPHSFDNTFGTTGTQGQAEALCLFGGQTAVESDQWYLWTAGAAGTATLTVCGGISGTSSNDTKVAVYAGSACPTSPAIACNDDAPCAASGLRSTVAWNIACGQTYLIQLGRGPGASASFGTFMILEFGTGCGPSTPYCAGDGTATACACANFGAAGHGCANSVDPAGAVLGSMGAARVSSDSLVLLASGMPNSAALYFQGTAPQNAGLGTVFGDGLRCAGGAVLRLGVQTNAAGASQHPGPADPPISIQGALPASGGTRYYQCWYRNAAAYCTPSTFNLTNGLEVVWTP